MQNRNYRIKKEEAVRGWHFLLGDGLTYNGNLKPVAGKTLSVLGEIKLCVNGLHGAFNPHDAANNVAASLVERTLHYGEIEEQPASWAPSYAKFCSRYRKCLWLADATPAFDAATRRLVLLFFGYIQALGKQFGGTCLSPDLHVLLQELSTSGKVAPIGPGQLSVHHNPQFDKYFYLIRELVEWDEYGDAKSRYKSITKAISIELRKLGYGVSGQGEIISGLILQEQLMQLPGAVHEASWVPSWYNAHRECLEGLVSYNPSLA